MIRIILAVFAIGLLAYPVVCLLDIESYRQDLEDLYGSAEANVAQLQTVVALHWLRNAYLAFAFLLMARFIGAPAKPGDLTRAGTLLMAYPIIHVIWQLLAQVAMSPDPEELDINIQLSSDYLLFCMLGLSVIGITRAFANNTTDSINTANTPDTPDGDATAPP